MPTVLENTAFDIVERVRLRIAHQEAGDTEYAEMRVHGGILGRAFLPLESGVGNQPAPGWVRIGHPHAKRAHAMCERRREAVTAVDHLQRADLPVGEVRICAGVCR